MQKRQLTDSEIAALESRGCQAEDWNNVLVADDFTPGKTLFRIAFSGKVELGSFRGQLSGSEGYPMRAGIDHSRLHDVRVGDNCLIHRSNVSNTDIGDNVVIYNVGALYRQGEAPFANGLPAHVLTEDGARSVPLWRHLSAQFAHLVCHLKGLPAAVALEEMIRGDSLTLRPRRSVVASGCRIRHTRLLRNVWLCEGSWIDGAASLIDCYVDSERSTPTRICEGVTAKECVFLPGSNVSGGVVIERCLVGEGAVLENGFSGKHSLFFANSEFGMGEALSAMAGPFATSHHKSSLILTCQSSFNTFGSGSNSSNHHFKLGPIHGGVLRRGVRCGSGSYLFWPSDVGAFTTVVGKHARHLDTTAFPFSLLLGGETESLLVPGVNLFTAGMFRDAAKWRDRDRRTGLSRPRDCVNPAILSPYVLQAMDAGAGLLERAAGAGGDLRHGGAVIPAARVAPALHLYRTALVHHLGERLFSRAMAKSSGHPPKACDVADVIRGANPDSASGTWRDWGGMLLPGAAAEDFLERLGSGEIQDPAEAQELLEAIHEKYDDYDLAWAAGRWLREYGEPTPEAITAFAARWREAVHFRHACFLKDAGKEFAPECLIGYGVETDAASAYRRLRGELSTHPLTARAEEERDALLEMAGRL